VLTQPTLEKLNAMKLTGMAQALPQQLGSGEYARLSFEERFGLLVDAEWTAREERKLARRLRSASLRHAASLEDVDFKHPASSTASRSSASEAAAGSRTATTS